MNYLIDTNIISETITTNPNLAVVEFLEKIPNEKIYLSVLSVGEIRKGIEKLPTGKKKLVLEEWFQHALPDWFEDRILSVDTAVANTWGILMEKNARTLSAIDGLIAATAMTYDLCVVTRNENDFRIPGVQVVNPWE